MANINGKLAELNSQAMIQLHKRCQEMQATGEDSNGMIRALRGDIKEITCQLEETSKANSALVMSYHNLEAEYRRFQDDVKRTYFQALEVRDEHQLMRVSIRQAITSTKTAKG